MTEQELKELKELKELTDNFNQEIMEHLGYEEVEGKKEIYKKIEE